MSGPPFYRVRRARKTYPCGSDGLGARNCRRIAVGEVHVVSSMPPGGEMGYLGWVRYRLCAPCVHHYSIPGEIKAAVPYQPCYCGNGELVVRSAGRMYPGGPVEPTTSTYQPCGHVVRYGEVTS